MENTNNKMAENATENTIDTMSKSEVAKAKRDAKAKAAKLKKAKAARTKKAKDAKAKAKAKADREKGIAKVKSVARERKETSQAMLKEAAVNATLSGTLDTMKTSAKMQFKLIRAIERESIIILTNYIKSMASTVNLDDEKLQNRIKYALRSEFGRVMGLTNLISSIACFPCEDGDHSELSRNQNALIETLDIDLCLMEDIKEARGYHSWLRNDIKSDEIAIVKPIKPDFDAYTMLVEEFLESILLQDQIENKLNMEINSMVLINKSNPTKWVAREKILLKNLKKELLDIEIASAEYEAELNKTT
ncbi:MAG: hypothetical protein L3I99_05785 [Sulfurimonas sp.]|nr:hypothetical protein [Sulfurimonas sp.]